MKNLITLISVFCIVGCQPSNHNAVHYFNNVDAFRIHQDADTWLYYYVLTSNFNGTENTYYYKSSTPVTNFSSVNFTRSTNSMPEEIQNAEKNGESLGTQQLQNSELPSDVSHDLASEMEAYNEYAETQGQIDSANNASENPGAGMDSTSSDSGGSSDTGGGGDSGGGGGGE